MPKTTKKTKEKKADFTKAKLKLGKGKQVANNATNTSFKARSIALPAQNPLLRSLKQHTNEDGPIPQEDDTRDTDYIPTSKRGLTLPEVLITLRHPNAGARRDGLSELKDVLIDGAESRVGPGYGYGYGRREGEVGRVINGILRMVPDEDSSVRKGLLVFLGWYLPLIPATTLPPHLPLLLLQSSSALSHIYPEIRMDACRLISLLLNLSPSQVVGEWPYATASKSAESASTTSGGSSSENNILEGLRLAAGIGGRTGEGGSNGMNLLPASKLVILRTMLLFVEEGLKKQGVKIAGGSGNTKSKGEAAASSKNEVDLPGGMFDAYLPSFRISKAEKSGNRDGRGIPMDEMEEGAPGGMRLEGSLVGRQDMGWLCDQEGMGNWGLSSLGDGGAQSRTDVGEVLSNLFLSLYPLLLSSLLEASPVALGNASSTYTNPSSPPDLNLALCLVIAQLTVALAGTVLMRESGREKEKTSGKGKGKEDGKVEEVRKAVVMMVGKLAVYFPFGGHVGVNGRGPNPETQNLLNSLSLSYANLVILLPARPSPLGPRLKSNNPRALELHIRAGFDAVTTWVGSRSSGKENFFMEQVADWICGILEVNGDALKAASLRPETYVSLLPLVWSMATGSRIGGANEEETVSGRVLESFIEHLLRSGMDSITRTLGNEFVMKMVEIHDDPSPAMPFWIPVDSPIRTLLLTWLESIPRVLYETSVKDPITSTAILHHLRRLCQNKSTLFSPENLLALDKKLVPFFYFQHPTKGALAGPWMRSTDHAVKLAALDLAIVICSEKESELALAVDQAVAGTTFEEYWRGRIGQTRL